MKLGPHSFVAKADGDVGEEVDDGGGGGGGLVLAWLLQTEVTMITRVLWRFPPNFCYICVVQLLQTVIA